MALYQWQDGLAQRDTPVLCLDYLQFARRVYGQGDARWFDAGPLLSICRQAQQGLKPDVLLFPVLEWVATWWENHVGETPQASRATKALKLALENTALLAALGETLQALGTLNRSDAAMALKLGSVEDWLQWIDAHASVEGAVDEGDAEDVCVYLAAFVHKLPASAFGSLFLHQGLPIDGDASVAFEALANTARHFGWALVLCTQDSGTVPQGFGLVAAPEPQGDQGWWADARLWSEGAEGTPTKAARFVVGAIPANAPPEPVLAALVQLRCTRV